MNIIHALMGCQKLSRVFTSTKPWHRDYVVCLDCGKEFEYSLERMEIVREIQRRPQEVDSVEVARRRA